MATLTVQPSAKDSTLQQIAPTINYGSAAAIYVADRDGSRNARAVIEFDISGLPVDMAITSATLSLYYYDYHAADGYGNPSGKTVWAYKLTRTDWVEAQVTWNIYKTANNWTTAGGDYVTVTPSGGSTTFPAAAGAWMNWNVKAIVQNAYSNGNPAEFLVRFATESRAGGSFSYFYSKEHATAGTRPKLTIDYKEAGGAPAGMAATLIGDKMI